MKGEWQTKVYKSYAGKYILPSATHLFACSNSAAKWLFANKADKALILKNGIECDKFVYSPITEKSIREELNLTEENFIVGHVGRFNHQKNHSFLVEIFSEIVEFNPNAYLLLIGEGPLKKEIQKRVTELDLIDKVKFLGVRNDVHHILKACNVMLFPSLHEGLPVTLIEAQGSGLPCIISDVITKEVDIGAGLIQYENLKSSPQVWAEKIFHSHAELKDTSEYIKKSGFDIKKSSVWLQDYYLNLVFNNKKGERMSV